MRALFLSIALALGAVSLGVAHAAPSAAPDFSLRDLQNTSHTLKQYRGKVVLLNFWATWCQPCQVEMPHLEKMYKELGGKGFVILGVSADAARDQSKVKPVVVGKGLTYPILLDPKTELVSLLNPTKTLPYNVIVDRKGNIVSQHAGYNPGDEAKLRAEIEALLAAP